MFPCGIMIFCHSCVITWKKLPVSRNVQQSFVILRKVEDVENSMAQVTPYFAIFFLGFPAKTRNELLSPQILTGYSSWPRIKEEVGAYIIRSAIPSVELLKAKLALIYKRAEPSCATKIQRWVKRSRGVAGREKRGWKRGEAVPRLILLLPLE